jgi:ribonuclease HI
VLYFMAFNRMRLNPAKCELVGRDARGQPVAHADIAAHDICVDGIALQPVSHDQSIRYLGAHCRFDGSWQTQFNKSLAMINTFTRVISKFHLSVSQAVYIFSVFVLPKLELALHFAHGPGTAAWLKSCDRSLVGCIKHAATSFLKLSHSAVALALGFHLPSWMEASIKVSELFLRMNSSDARWGHIGRLALRHESLADVNAATPVPRPDTSSRLARAAYLAVRSLRWEWHLVGQHRAGSRHRRMFDGEPLGPAPSLAECSSSPLVAFIGGRAMIAHDAWSGWGAAVPPQTVQVYTDGSYCASPSASAWSVTVGDAWLDANFLALPADEKLLRAGHVINATLIGASIACSQGVYPAELQAIARALAMFPLSFSLDIHSDSQASIAAIRSYEGQPNERKRMRMASRPLLQLVHSLLTRRAQAGGVVEIQHVPAHTDKTDLHSVGNRLADFQANLARDRPDRSAPISLRELPLSACEHHFRVQQQGGSMLIDDIRRAALSQLRELAMVHWANQPDRGKFACDGMVELGRIARLFGTPTQQATLVHVATNSAHFHWVYEPPPSRICALQQMQCAHCNTAFDLSHLALCPSPSSSLARLALRDDIVNLLTRFAAADPWLRRHAHLILDQLLLALFPPGVVAAGADPLAHRDRHLTLCMLGAFTPAESSAAAKSLGLAPCPSDALRAMRDLRLLCLESIDKIYTPLKARP